MGDKKRAPQLLDEPPLLVYPSLAVTLGINRAIIFQQLHFLLNGQKTANNQYNYVADDKGVMRWWVYNSYPEWRMNYFPWLSTSAIKGMFNSLEDDSLVIARQSVKHKSDRRKWYTIDYEVWDKKCLMVGQKMSDEPIDKNCPMDESENGRSNGQKSSNDSSETPSEFSSDFSSENSPLDEQHQAIWVTAKDQLRLQLDASLYNTWLADVRLAGFDNNTFVLAVRNQFALSACEGQLYKSVRRLLRDASGKAEADVRFVVAQPGAQPHAQL